jgi:hypothetical protein
MLSYTIDSVEYIAECITFGQDYNYLFEQQLRQQGIDISFHSYRSHHHSLQSSTTQVIQLAQNSKSVKGVYCVMRDKKRYRSSNHESLSCYKSGRLVDYQFDLGGRLFPEFPINVTNSGEGSCYANNLNSFNHFRDHNGGCELTRETFCPHNNSDLLGHASYANHSGVTARFHGYLIGNSGGLNDSTMGKLGTDADIHDKTGVTEAVLSSNLFFRPSNLLDLKHINLGDRIKVNQVTKDADLETAGWTKNQGYDESPADGEGNGHSFLYVVGVGVEVMIRDKTADGTPKQNVLSIPGCVVLAKTDSGQNSAGMHNANSYLATPFGGLGTPKVDGATAPTYTAGNACYLDRVPSDDDFYIGQSFETHDEHERLISGTDLTNTVPLHINLKFLDTDNDGAINPPVKQGDLLTAFLHYDSVLRIEQDGSCVSSM